MSRRKYRIILFSFGVMMILVRPFMAYQLSTTSDFGKDPQRIYNLLQRLVKKKDDHHADDNELTAVLTQGEAQLVPASRTHVAFVKDIFRRHRDATLRAPLVRIVNDSFLAHYNILICKFQI